MTYPIDVIFLDTDKVNHLLKEFCIDFCNKNMEAEVLDPDTARHFTLLLEKLETEKLITSEYLDIILIHSNDPYEANELIAYALTGQEP